MRRVLRGLVLGGGLAFLLLLAAPALAYWSSYEYYDKNGDTRYGIRNGSDTIPLNQKKRAKADKAAKEMNEVEQGVKAGPDGQGDYAPGLSLPKN